MSDSRRLQRAWVALSVTAIAELVRHLFFAEPDSIDFIQGFQLVFLLIAIGYSAKLAGNMSSERKYRNQSFIILVLSTLLGVYLYIL